MFDLERRINLFVNDISSVIIVNDLHILQIPGFGFRAVGSATCHVVCDDIVVRVLLKHLNVVERAAPRKEILNKPSAQIGSIAKNLPLDVTTGTGLRFRNKILARQFCMGRKRIVHRHAGSHSEQSHPDQRQQNARKTYTRREHGDNFVGARHSAQSKKERQQKRNRQQNDQNLRDLCSVITKAKKQTDMFVDKSRNVIAHVENEPDGDEAGDAVKIDLQEIANDISVEKLHDDLEQFRVVITVLKSMTRAKSQEKNDEFSMTKAERMTNDQLTKHDDVGSSSLELWAPFVVRRSSFVISCCK